MNEVEVKYDEMLWYIHERLLPKLRQMRYDGEILCNQTSTITINYEEYQYIGDTDKVGNACGWGSTVEKQGMRFSGTFFNN